MLGILRCLLLRHEPDRRRVKKISAQVYSGYCRHCGAQIRRKRRDSWVRDRQSPTASPD